VESYVLFEADLPASLPLPRPSPWHKKLVCHCISCTSSISTSCHTQAAAVFTPYRKRCTRWASLSYLAAQAATAALGVTAQRVVRHGNVGDKIIGLCRDLGADYVVLGRPQAQGKENIFTKNLLKKFSERIERETMAMLSVSYGRSRKKKLTCRSTWTTMMPTVRWVAFSMTCTCTSASIPRWAISLRPNSRRCGERSKPWPSI